MTCGAFSSHFLISARFLASTHVLYHLVVGTEERRGLPRVTHVGHLEAGLVEHLGLRVDWHVCDDTPATVEGNHLLPLSAQEDGMASTQVIAVGFPSRMHRTSSGKITCTCTLLIISPLAIRQPLFYNYPRRYPILSIASIDNARPTLSAP